MTDDRLARMGLAAAHDAGDQVLVKLVREQGAGEVWDFIRSGRGQTSLAQRAAGVDLDELRRQTEAAQARFLVPGDPEWPAGVADLAWGDSVGGYGGEPLGLWVLGKLRLDQMPPGVAIIGSRASTAYGEHVASDWSAGVAEKGYVVVSGGAYGIDACAHRGAVAAGGRTLAVMAGGLRQFYPAGNAALIRKIAEVGAVVSEYPPDHPPSRTRFLVRNRLIAALSKVTLIIEGAVRSGAQNTVSWALSIQRPVLAAPGPVTSAMSVTPHRLIRNGEAVLVGCMDDVLAALRPFDSSIPNYRREQPTVLDSLTAEQRQIHEALSARRSLNVDELAALTGQPVYSLMVGLGQLRQAGLAVETRPSQWRAVPKSKDTSS